MYEVVESAGEGVAESVVVEAEREEIDEGWRERLKETWRLARGTRRCEEGESEDRVDGGELVWKVHGVRSVGWIRQPRAAVRRLGAVHSILVVVCGLEGSDRRCEVAEARCGETW